MNRSDFPLASVYLTWSLTVWRRYPLLGLLLSLLLAGFARGQDDAQSPPRLPVFRRLSEPFLQQLDQARAALSGRVQSKEVPYPFVRGTFHMHSHLSHDSVGTLEEIIAAAKATGTRVIGLTEHKSRAVDVVAANATGWRDGVFFLAGTENSNELHWPATEGADDVRFLCHLEEIPSFDRRHFDGIEIYNTHSDAKDEPIGMLVSAMAANMGSVRDHPEGAFCALLDYPADFLTRYDRLTLSGRYPGIAGNDSHQNQSLRVAVLPDGSIEVEDYADEVVWTDSGLRAKMLLAAFAQHQPPAERKVLAHVQLDPYEISMRHVGTFLQIGEVSQRSVRRALVEGRIVLGFELIAPLPSIGFWVEAGASPVGTVGDEVALQPNLKLRVDLPAAAQIRVVRNGETFASAVGNGLELELLEAGVYRMEAQQVLAGQRYPWVITNPIYVVDGEKS